MVKFAKQLHCIYFYINGLVYLFIDAFCHKSKTRCTCFTGHDISAQLSASLFHLDLEPANILVRNVHWDDIYRTFGHAVQGCRQRERGLKPPQILSSSYYVYKQLPQKDIQNVLLQKNQRGKNSFQVISSVTHTKNLSLDMIRLLLRATNSILEAKPPTF